MMRYVYLIIALSIFHSCTPDSDSKGELFRELSSTDTGIDFANDLTYQTDLNIIEYLYYYNGGGVAVGDINGDGLEDIYFTANQKSDQLYLNLGNLKFKNVSQEAGLSSEPSWSTGVTMDDINGDGFLDIYVCKVSSLANASPNTHNLLYINDGQGVFEERSAEYGLDFRGYSTQASFFDYDNDGDLDAYLLNHSVHSTSSYGKAEKRQERDTLSGDLLFENRLNQEGKFVNVSEAAGIYSSALGYGLTMTTSDINGDTWPDIYVGNDFHENDYLYINNQDGTFSELITDWTNHTSQFTMGVDAADMNGDGRIDLFTTDMMPYDPKILMKSASNDSEQIANIKKDLGFGLQYARNHFHLNTHEGYFKEVAQITQTAASDWSWSPLIQDFNQDGQMDVFITNGIVKRPNDLDYINYVNERAQTTDERDEDAINKALIDKMPTLRLQNIMFEGSEYSEYSPFKRNFIGTPSFSTGAAYSDLDNDGDLDLIVNNVNSEATLLENTIPVDQTHFISFSIVPSVGRSAKGTKITVFQNGRSQMLEYQTTKGFESASSHRLHFTLLGVDPIDSIIVAPQGVSPYRSQSHYEIDKHHKVSLSANVDLVNEPSSNTTINRFEINLLPYNHVEDDYKDIDREKLIPEILSKEGPAVVYADFNGDRIADLFLGGSRVQAASLLLGDQDGTFDLQDVPSFENDKFYEDVNAAALDFDQDGDLDLYVVSGGNDKKELDKLLQDRLYINDGNGSFDRVALSLPHTNGGTVSVGDYNGDSFPDLFIGARSIPGSYGLSPYSFILKNVNGQNIELIQKQRFGMLTDSRWIDMNGDDQLDLVMVGEWMPVTVYLNQGDDQFENATLSFRLNDTKGMWNRMTFTDLNQDSRPDILVGNRGLNTVLKASPEKPLSIYLDDFDKNGQVDPVIFYNQEESFIPFPFKDNLTAQLPFLKKKFNSYESFTEVSSIDDLTGKTREDILEYLEVTELRSMIFLSGEKGYSAIPLNDEAQLSTIQDVHIRGSLDKIEMLYVGNSKTERHQLGYTMSDPGGLLSDFDPSTNQFNSWESLGLPHNIVAKRIISISEKDYLIICNDGAHYHLHFNEG